MNAADRDLVDQGRESELFVAVDQQRLARPPQNRREVPEQGGSCEPGAEEDHARTAAHARGHGRERPSSTPLSPSLHSAYSGSISFAVSPLGETLYKTRA